MASLGQPNSTSTNDRSKKSSAQVRRHQIAVACEQCRRRKVKCNGTRPCTECDLRGVPCVYEAQAGETRTQAVKRKYEDLEQSHDALLELIDLAASRRDALDILSRVKHGDDIHDMLARLKEGENLYEAHLGGRSRVRRMLLSALIQSSASVQKIIELAPFLAEERLRVDLLETKEWRAQTNRLVSARMLSHLILGVNENGTYPSMNSYAASQSDARSRVDTLLDVPAFAVPALPWTRLTRDDDLVSHLVSVFLTTNNIYWRYVEEDLFVASMQSGSIITEYCSPFLIHAICAMACSNSEHPAAFLHTDDFISRGEHFHYEALRLWLLEEGRASLTNLQALVILSVESGFRGKDKLTVTLLAVALQMNKDLPFTASSEGKAAADRARARSHASWAAHHFDVTCSLGLLRPSTILDPRMDYMPNLPDSRTEWSGAPFVASRVMFRPSALMRERCVLTRLNSEVNLLLFAKQESMSSRDFEKATTDLKGRLLGWYHMLPDDLIFRSGLPAPVYELHGTYFCAIILLCSHTETLVPAKKAAESQARPSPANSTASDTPEAAPAPESLLYALQAARMCQHYRETYGLKITSCFVFQTAALVCLILLNRLDFSLTYSSALREGNPIPFYDATSAFEESYRCLLGIGTRVMIARGVARMVYQTSKVTGRALPESASKVRDIVADATWGASDVHRISSSYPNYSMPENVNGAAEATMEALLKQWEAVQV
ncbi:hypothetical protein LTR95_009366 [Oleoguttula sp. CCFEE 5521]